MDQHKQPSDRIRRILQSMERSIDSARDQRLNRSRPAAPAMTPQRVAAPPPMQRESTIGQSPAAQDDASRLKARPKRPDSGFFRDWNNRGLRSKAG